MREGGGLLAESCRHIAFGESAYCIDFVLCVSAPWQVTNMLHESGSWESLAEIKPLVDKIFLCLDPNGSGGITIQEFQDGFHRFMEARTTSRASLWTCDMKRP